MSVEMLTPLFTPMTQVSADDSRHEVRLTISDDVQAILHTDQHLLVTDITYGHDVVSYMLRCDNHKILLPRPCPRRGKPRAKRPATHCREDAQLPPVRLDSEALGPRFAVV